MSEGAIIIPAVPTGKRGRGGRPTKYGILQGGSRSSPWEGRGRIAQLLGIPRKQFRQYFNRAPRAERSRIKDLARSVYLTGRASQFEERGQMRQAARFTERAGRDFPVETLPTTLRDLVDVVGAARGIGGIIGRAESSRQRERRERRERRRPLIRNPITGTVYPAPASPVVYATQPAPQQPADVPEWVQLLAIARDWWLAREEEKAARREARRIQKEEQMALGDFISGLGGAISSTISAVSPAVAAIYNERAARSIARGGMTGASGVPLSFAAGAPMLGSGGLGALGAGAAGLLLGEEPGLLEGGGILERLGLEGDLERTGTFWRRTASGFRPVTELQAVHPTSGRIGSWTYRGRPLMYSRDLAICRDVQKVARGAAARTGLRFRKRGRRR